MNINFCIPAGSAINIFLGIPMSFLASEIATRVYELGIRVLINGLDMIKLKPTSDNWIVKLADEWVIDIRSHKNKDTKKLVKEIFAITIILFTGSLIAGAGIGFIKNGF